MLDMVHQMNGAESSTGTTEAQTNLKIALRQRLRWSKGHLLAFIETSPKLVRNIIFGRKYAKNKKNYDSLKLNIIDSIRYRFASFDILMLSIPFSVIILLDISSKSFM